MNPIRVILADDHDVFRGQMRSLLDQPADITVVAAAGTGESAVSAIREHNPDVAVAELVNCIRVVHEGRPYLSSHVTFTIAPPRKR